MAAPRVELQTSMGTFTVELYVNHAPKTAKNFMELSSRGYYNGTVVSWWGVAARIHTAGRLECVRQQGTPPVRASERLSSYLAHLTWQCLALCLRSSIASYATS